MKYNSNFPRLTASNTSSLVLYHLFPEGTGLEKWTPYGVVTASSPGSAGRLFWYWGVLYELCVGENKKLVEEYILDSTNWDTDKTVRVNFGF